ncbi:hypothetical protein D6829_00910 [Candidatus Pacearchaeota archaeon]|nr:MAG: hypothetical protein D6829_00910 [Candidatus Pacearchaeota archaeon]
MTSSSVISNIANFIGGENNVTYVLLFFTSVIILYSIFVFYFYRFLARRNILELNLNQYNVYENPAVVKIFAVVFYIIEHIILLPIMTFFWFAVLSILILILAEGIDVGTILLISAAMVASVRVTAHVSESLSKDLAKMLPFTLLAIAITKPGFFNISSLLSRIYEVPTLFTRVPQYLIFIVAVELIMKFAEFLNSFSSPEERIIED